MSTTEKGGVDRDWAGVQGVGQPRTTIPSPPFTSRSPSALAEMRLWGSLLPERGHVTYRRDAELALVQGPVEPG